MYLEAQEKEEEKSINIKKNDENEGKDLLTENK